MCVWGANDLIKISKKNLENKKEKKIMVTVMSYKNCDKKNKAREPRPNVIRTITRTVFVFKMSKVENDQIEDTCSLI